MFEKVNEPRLDGVAFFCPKCHRSTKGAVGKVENTQAIQCELCGATWKLAFIACEAKRADPKSQEDTTAANRSDKKIDFETIGPPSTLE